MPHPSSRDDPDREATPGCCGLARYGRASNCSPSVNPLHRLVVAQTAVGHHRHRMRRACSSDPVRVMREYCTRFEVKCTHAGAVIDGPMTVTTLQHSNRMPPARSSSLLPRYCQFSTLSTAQWTLSTAHWNFELVCSQNPVQLLLHTFSCTLASAQYIAHLLDCNFCAVHLRNRKDSQFTF